MFLTGFGQNVSGPGYEAEGPVGGQGGEPGALQGAWGNNSSTDPGLPVLQGAARPGSEHSLKILGISVRLPLPALTCELLAPHSHAATMAVSMPSGSPMPGQ